MALFGPSLQEDPAIRAIRLGVFDWLKQALLISNNEFTREQDEDAVRAGQADEELGQSTTLCQPATLLRKLPAVRSSQAIGCTVILSARFLAWARS
jgi:hypothetical protein